jgi:hypothetical protein
MTRTSIFSTTLLFFLLTACEPIGPIPGGSLSGTLEPVPGNWESLDKKEIVQVETLAADKSYSVNVWGVGLGKQYYVASAKGSESRWARRIARNKQVRLRIETSVFELAATIVTEQSEREMVSRAFEEKYDMSSSDDFPDVLLYRLEPN